MDFHKPQDSTSAASATTKRMMMIMMRDKPGKQNTSSTTTTNNNNKKTSIKLEDDQQEHDSDDEDMKTTTTIIAEEKKQKRLSPTTPAAASTGRRVASGGGGGVLDCQAEKCTADLTDAKRYHRRHKVCELHAKAPSVLVAGLRQRFCQQCSRFHELSEFDETKRSCRRRLAGHNERRRKSSSELQGEGGSSSHTKGSNLQLRPGDNNGTSSFKHFPIK